MRDDYRNWLKAQQYDAGTITAQMHRAGRVEKYHGDLDQHFAYDRLQGLLDTLRYSADDQRRGRANPSKIPFDGDIRNNLASYRNAIERYSRFLNEAGTDRISSLEAPTVAVADVEDLGQRIGLERDMQAALRKAIDDLEDGLVIIDGGAERSVESGFIDITARNAQGDVVVIELKAGAAGQRAVAQILSYMGDVATEEQEANVKGILVASDFDSKSRAAAKMVPALTLVSYGVKFKFARL